MKIPDSVKKAYKVAVKTRLNSYSPYSKFKVGAAVITSKNEIYAGTNVENCSYGGTICAERVAICDAVKNGVKKIAHVVVVADTPSLTPPCGLCRQVIAEFANSKTKIWLSDLEGIKAVYSFEDILPHAFTPASLK